MSKYKPPESNDSPDLTPMIDVVFLLIVFFMVVAQRMSEQYIALDSLAIAANAQVSEQPPPRTIISVSEDPINGYQYYWGEQLIDESAITEAVKRHPDWSVLLRVTPEITQATVDDVLQLIAAGGQSKVIFAVFEVAQ